jgi:hypothetical protein
MAVCPIENHIRKTKGKLLLTLTRRGLALLRPLPADRGRSEAFVGLSLPLVD